MGRAQVLYTCVWEVKVDVVISPSLIVRTVSVDVKRHCNARVDHDDLCSEPSSKVQNSVIRLNIHMKMTTEE